MYEYLRAALADQPGAAFLQPGTGRIEVFDGESDRVDALAALL